MPAHRLPPFVLRLIGVPMPPPDPEALRIERKPGWRTPSVVTGPEDKVRAHVESHRSTRDLLENVGVVEEPHEIAPGVWRAATYRFWDDN